MNALWVSLSSDTATLIALGFTALLAIVSVVTVVVLGRSAASVVASLKPRLLSLLDAPPAPSLRSNERLLLRAIQDMIVFVERTPAVRFVTKGLDDRAIEAASESMLEHGAGTWVLRIGEHLTAIALTLTFTLLGLVLTQDVTDAIRDNAGNGAASMRNEALVHAFAKMGGKFFISAVGLVGAVIFRWARDAALKRITLAVEALIDSHRTAFVTEERQKHESAIRDHRALIGAIGESASRLEQALTSMRSIEVSVQAVGHEVSTHLGKLMKDSLADELGKNLGELRVVAENIAARVEATLTDALNAQVQEILRGLEALRTTVQERAGGEVEALLDKMKDLLSGGFQSAQGDMSAQMGALTGQLKDLVNQVAQASQRVTGEAGARSEEMQRQMEALLSRTNEVLQAMQSAQGAVTASSAQSADSVRNAAAAAIEQTKSATAELDEQARRVEGSLEKILNDLEKALQSTSTVVQKFGEQASNAQALSRTTYDAAQKFASGSTTIQQATLKFDENLRTLAELINKQQSSQSEFARVVPASIGEVQKRLSDQTKELSAAWKELQGALDTSVKTIAGQLSEPIENLGDHVDNLQRALKEARR